MRRPRTFTSQRTKEWNIRKWFMHTHHRGKRHACTLPTTCCGQMEYFCEDTGKDWLDSPATAHPQQFCLLFCATFDTSSANRSRVCVVFLALTWSIHTDLCKDLRDRIGTRKKRPAASRQGPAPPGQTTRGGGRVLSIRGAAVSEMLQ